MTISEETGGSATPSMRDSSGTLIDLAIVLVLTAATIVVTTVPVIDAPKTRAAIGLLFVLFMPGYAAVSALFPERHSESANTTPISSGNINGVERVTLSFGMSLGIVPLLALVINFSPLRLELGTIMATLGGFIVVATIVAAQRRLSLAVPRRFGIPYRRWFHSARQELVNGSPIEAVPVLIIIVSILIAGTGVGQTVLSPQSTETYTEFYLLSGEQDGIGQAMNYTTDLNRSDEYSLIVGIGNQEQETLNYTVIVRLQQLQVQGNVSKPVASKELTRFETTVAQNRTEERRVTFLPTVTGERLRLQFLLYREDVPSAPGADSAYRETHLWVNVS